MRAQEWSIPDLIDLEFFLSHGGDPADASPGPTDRGIFLETVEHRLAGTPPGSVPYRRGALRLWMEKRRSLYRAQDPRAVLPGEVFRDSRSLLSILLAASGLVSGAAVALPLLTYTGRAAVNVTLYLGVLVFLQLLGLILMVRFLFFRAPVRLFGRHSLPYGLLGRALEGIASRVMRGASPMTVGRYGLDTRALPVLLRELSSAYGHVLFWPFFGMAQLFGIMFNAGAIGATIVRVLTADLAFGWQSTLQMSPGMVHAMVRTLAAPWAWLLGAHAHPTLAEIEGSRMILKEGISALATGNLVSWWPFLVSAVVCYGLLPRVLLGIAAAVGEHRALARVQFAHAGCDQLLVRMRSPGLSTSGTTDHAPVPLPAPEQPEGRSAVFLSCTDALVLVPEDLVGRYDPAELEAYLVTRLGLKPVAVLPVTGWADGDRPTIGHALMGREDDDRAVVLVQEAWLPPIVETAGLIAVIRASGGSTLKITVLLVGKPAGETILTPVRPMDRTIWSRALAGLADPHLSLAAAGDP